MRQDGFSAVSSSRVVLFYPALRILAAEFLETGFLVSPLYEQDSRQFKPELSGKKGIQLKCSGPPPASEMS